MERQPGPQYHHCVHAGDPMGPGEKEENFQAKQPPKLPNAQTFANVWKYPRVSDLARPAPRTFSQTIDVLYLFGIGYYCIKMVF